MELSELLERQRAFFAAGTTRPLKFRMEALERLGGRMSFSRMPMYPDMPAKRN